MKLKTTTSVVETNNVTTGNTFGIKSSPKTFAILSSGLYSDKIEAVVRELSCNAYDSHVDRNKLIDAGKATKHTAPRDKNLRICFPTTFDPFFSVRDFGIGLTPEDVENIYTVYFESTKQDSNDYIGALGLGSKSPFSYSDSFNVIATKNGHRVVYSMFINSQGIPQPAKLDEGPVEEFYMPGEEIPPEEFFDGVEVKVPAEPSDDSSFWRAAEDVYRYFVVKPELVNYNGSKIVYYKQRDGVEKFIDGVYINGHDGYRSTQHAIQGNVAYPIDLKEEDFKRAIKDIDKFEEGDQEQCQLSLEEIDNLYRFYKNVLTSFTLYIRFNIGDLDVAASREELSYDASTIMSIILQVKRIYSEIETRFDNHMANFTTKWEQARELLRIDGNSYHSHNRGSMDRFFQKTGSPEKYLKHANIPQLKIDGSSYGSRLSYDAAYTEMKIPEERDYSVRICGRQSFKRFVRVYHNNDNPQRLHGFVDNGRVHMMQEDTVIVVNDTKRGGATLAKEFFQTESSKARCVLLEPEKLGEVGSINDLIEDFELKTDNPGIEVHYLSQVKEDYPDLTKSTVRPKANVGYYQLHEAYGSVAAINTSIPEEFTTAQVVYIPFKQQRPSGDNLNFDEVNAIGKGAIQSTAQLTRILDYLDTILGDKMPAVIGLNQNMLRQVPDYDNWVCITDFVADQLNRLFGTEKKRKAVEDCIVEKRKTNDVINQIEWPMSNKTCLKIRNRILEFDSLDDLREVIDVKVNGLASLSTLEELYDMVYAVDYVSDVVLDINTKYGMLTIMKDEYSWSEYDDETVETIINYCLSCNKQGESV